MAGYAIPLSRWFKDGAVSAGAKVYVYQTGTTTPVDVYSDPEVTTPLSNPIVCDSNGEALFYVSTDYTLRVYVTTSGGTLIRDIPEVYPVPVLTGLTASATQLNYLSGVTAGTATASKALVLNSSKEVTGITRIGTDAYLSPHFTGKNLIIGGDFGTNPWQRGTSFSSVADGTLTADRWKYIKSGAMVHTISRDTDVPTVAQAGRLVTASLRLNLTTPDTSISAGEYCAITQRVEGNVFQKIAQRAFTLSFWVKATTTGTYAVGFRNSGGDRSYVATYNVLASNTWERKTITVSASPSAGTWNYTTGIGIEVAFTLACGSTYQTASGSWATGSFLASTAYGNFTDTGATDFRLALVQLEPGSGATEYDTRSVSQELPLCQRYFEKSFPAGTVPADNTGSYLGAHEVPQVVGASATQAGGTIYFKVTKMTTPSVTTYSPGTTGGNFYNPTVGAATSGLSLPANSETGFSTTFSTAGGSAAGNRNAIHWTAEAEL